MRNSIFISPKDISPFLSGKAHAFKKFVHYFSPLPSSGFAFLRGDAIFALLSLKSGLSTSSRRRSHCEWGSAVEEEEERGSNFFQAAFLDSHASDQATQQPTEQPTRGTESSNTLTQPTPAFLPLLLYGIVLGCEMKQTYLGWWRLLLLLLLLCRTSD